MDQGFRASPVFPRAVICAALFTISGLALVAKAEDATVTVYNHGSQWTTDLPGTNHNIFWGCIFDADVRLGCFREQKMFSQIKSDRFVVFHFRAGQHVFAASYGKHPAKRSQLDVTLEAGKHYYLRSQSESRGVVEIEWVYGRMDNMSCADAMRELQKAKPLPDKLLSPQGRAATVAGQAIPPCP